MFHLEYLYWGTICIVHSMDSIPTILIKLLSLLPNIDILNETYTIIYLYILKIHIPKGNYINKILIMNNNIQF